MQTEFGINAWSIPSIGLFSDNGEDEFTIFNPENVYGSKESMRERYGEEFNPASDVFFKPKRLLLHSLIVYFSCMVQSNDIKDMQQKIINQYEYHTT